MVRFFVHHVAMMQSASPSLGTFPGCLGSRPNMNVTEISVAPYTCAEVLLFAGENVPPQ